MTVDPTPISGKVFTHPLTGVEYGVIRLVSSLPVAVPDNGTWIAIAEDGSGNEFRFSHGAGIAFWDHETDEQIPLAATWETFCAGCGAPSPVTLDPSQVKSVWVDPEFARKLGMQVPPDGWVKRSDEGATPSE
jgi:hypothetical protein